MREQIPPATTSIDRSVLARLVNHDPVKFSRFALKFIDTSRATLVEMQRSCQRGDLVQLGRLAHRLKSAAATVGAAGLAVLCRQLETACQADDMPRSGQLVGGLAPALDLIDSELLGGIGT